MVKSLYDSPAMKKGDAKKPEAEPAKTPDKPATDAAPADPKADAAGKPGADKSAARKALYKAHETERRDLHNAFREQHRTMEARHDKALNGLMEMDEAGGAEPEAAVEAGAGE